MIWSNLTTEQRIEAVREKHQPGYSARQIASFFDGASRNAIVGMYHRYPDRFLDKPLPVASKFVVAKRPRGDKSLKVKPRMTASKPLPTVRIDAPIIVGRPLAAISGGMCKFAVNETEPGETHLFCGEASEGAWCPYHRRLVYGPGTESERSAHRVRKGTE